MMLLCKTRIFLFGITCIFFSLYNANDIFQGDLLYEFKDKLIGNPSVILNFFNLADEDASQDPKETDSSDSNAGIEIHSPILIEKPANLFLMNDKIPEELSVFVKFKPKYDPIRGSYKSGFLFSILDPDLETIRFAVQFRVVLFGHAVINEMWIYLNDNINRKGQTDPIAKVTLPTIQSVIAEDTITFSFKLTGSTITTWHGCPQQSTYLSSEKITRSVNENQMPPGTAFYLLSGGPSLKNTFTGKVLGLRFYKSVSGIDEYCAENEIQGSGSTKKFKRILPEKFGNVLIQTSTTKRTERPTSTSTLSTTTTELPTSTTEQKSTSTTTKVVIPKNILTSTDILTSSNTKQYKLDQQSPGSDKTDIISTINSNDLNNKSLNDKKIVVTPKSINFNNGNNFENSSEILKSTEINIFNRKDILSDFIQNEPKIDGVFIQRSDEEDLTVQVKKPVNLARPSILYFSNNKFPTDFGFSIEFNFQQTDGYLFALVDPDGTTVRLGLRIQNQTDSMNGDSLKMRKLFLYFNDDVNIVGEEISVASVPLPMTNKRKLFLFYIFISQTQVTIWSGCPLDENQISNVGIKRNLETNMKKGSALYLFSAGDLLKGYFKGTVHQLKLFYSFESMMSTCNKKIEGSGKVSDRISSPVTDEPDSEDNQITDEPITIMTDLTKLPESTINKDVIAIFDIIETFIISNMENLPSGVKLNINQPDTEETHIEIKEKVTIQQPAMMIYPNLKFPNDLGIIVDFIPNEGFILSIMDQDLSTIRLALSVSIKNQEVNNQIIQIKQFNIHFNDRTFSPMSSESIVASVPLSDKTDDHFQKSKFLKLSILISRMKISIWSKCPSDEMILYEHEITRSSEEPNMKIGGSIYLFSAGPLLNGYYMGSIRSLKLFNSKENLLATCKQNQIEGSGKQIIPPIIGNVLEEESTTRKKEISTTPESSTKVSTTQNLSRKVAEKIQESTTTLSGKVSDRINLTISSIYPSTFSQFVSISTVEKGMMNTNSTFIVEEPLDASTKKLKIFTDSEIENSEREESLIPEDFLNEYLISKVPTPGIISTIFNEDSEETKIKVIKDVHISKPSMIYFPNNKFPRELGFVAEFLPSSEVSKSFLFAFIDPDLKTLRLAVEISWITEEMSGIQSKELKVGVYLKDDNNLEVLPQKPIISANLFISQANKKSTYKISFLINENDIQLWHECPSPKNLIRTAIYKRNNKNQNLKPGGILYLFSGGPSLQNYYQGEILSLKMIKSSDQLVKNCRSVELEGSGTRIIPRIEGNILITETTKSSKKIRPLKTKLTSPGIETSTTESIVTKQSKENVTSSKSTFTNSEWSKSSTMTSQSTESPSQSTITIRPTDFSISESTSTKSSSKTKQISKKKSFTKKKSKKKLSTLEPSTVSSMIINPDLEENGVTDSSGNENESEFDLLREYLVPQIQTPGIIPTILHEDSEEIKIKINQDVLISKPSMIYFPNNKFPSELGVIAEFRSSSEKGEAFLFSFVDPDLKTLRLGFQTSWKTHEISGIETKSLFINVFFKDNDVSDQYPQKPILSANLFNIPSNKKSSYKMSFLMKGDEFQLWNDCPSPQNQIRSTRYSRSYENENLKTGGILYLFSGGPDLTDYFQGEIITLEMFGTNEKLLRKCRTSEIEGSGKFIIPKIQGNALITKEQNETNISTVKTKQIINSTKPTTTTTIPSTTTTIPTTTTLLPTTTTTTISTTTTTKPTTTTLQQTTNTTMHTTTTQQPTTTTKLPTTTTTIPNTTTQQPTTTTTMPNPTTTIPTTTTQKPTTTTTILTTTTLLPTTTTTIPTTTTTMPTTTTLIPTTTATTLLPTTTTTMSTTTNTIPTTTTQQPTTTTTIPTTTTLLPNTTTTIPTTTMLQQTTTTTLPTTTTTIPTTTTTMPTPTTTIPITTTLLPTTTTTIPTTTTTMPTTTTTIPTTTTLQSTTTTLLATTATTTPTMTTTIRTTNSTLFPLNATDLELSMNRYEVTLNVSMNTSTLSPGFTSNNNSDGRMKIDKWNKGEKGDKGNQGDKGDKGIAGSPGKPGKSESCPISNCNLLKGEKGSPGIQGQCSTSTCLSIKGEKGDVGPIGPQGERGFMGEQGKSQQIYEDVIRKVVIEQLLIPDVQNLFKREKGEVGQATNCNCESSLTVSPKLRGLQGLPGKDGMGLDRIVNYGYGAIIVKSRDDLDRIGHYLSPGSLVLVINQENGSGMKKDPILMIKVTDNPNIWRQLNAFLGEEQFLPSSNTFKRIPVQKPNPDNILHNQKKLYFILLPEPWRGNIRVSEANHLCQKFAADNSYIGIFQAFLEDQSRNLKSLMPAKYWHSWQIVNKNEETLFFSWSQMFNGYSRKPGVPLLTFEGHDVLDIDPWRSKFMWVGGALDIYQETVPSCRDWTSSSPTDFGMTINLENVLFLNKVIKRPCGNSYYIGCIQVSPYETRNL